MKRYDRYLLNMIHGRIRFIMILSVVTFGALLYRLYDLQIHEENNYKLQALKQRSIEISLNSNRGTIFDRNLIPLTNMETSKYLLGPREIIVNNHKLLNKIKESTSLSDREFSQLIDNNDRLLQIPLKKQMKLEGVHNLFIVDKVDRYSKFNTLSHVIGYINKAENKGEYGLEKVYDEFLSNSDTLSMFIEYDKRSSMVLGGTKFVDNHLGLEDPSGVKLTIDYNIQRTLEKILDESNENGAAIISKVDSGEILAMASRPNFNQNKMEEYFNREDMVLYNKAIQVSYPPGSTFKMVVLLAALEEDMNFINKEFYCKGYEEVNNLKIKCNNPNGHGRISLRDGLAKSCNSVFIQLGKEIGAKKIIAMAERLGLGQRIGIGLLEEVDGLLPQNEELLGPAIGNIAIGQGKIEVTPLQMTNVLLTIANNGISKGMTIIEGITTKDGRVIKPYNKMEDKRVIDAEIAGVAKEYLGEVINIGTARNIDLDNIGGAAGKTGSAEAILRGQPTIHGWFAGYYPRDNPKYVITVLVEEASLGSKSAIPIFERICKELYRLDK